MHLRAEMILQISSKDFIEFIQIMQVLMQIVDILSKISLSKQVLLSII